MPNNRSLRPIPTAELNPEDAARLDVKEGGRIDIYTARGSITVHTHLTKTVPAGMVNMYHGYREADVNTLMDPDHLDPYSGFPGFRSTRCGVRKTEE